MSHGWFNSRGTTVSPTKKIFHCSSMLSVQIWWTVTPFEKVLHCNDDVTSRWYWRNGRRRNGYVCWRRRIRCPQTLRTVPSWRLLLGCRWTVTCLRMVRMSERDCLPSAYLCYIADSDPLQSTLRSILFLRGKTKLNAHNVGVTLKQ